MGEISQLNSFHDFPRPISTDPGHLDILTFEYFLDPQLFFNVGYNPIKLLGEKMMLHCNLIFQICSYVWNKPIRNIKLQHGVNYARKYFFFHYHLEPHLRELFVLWIFLFQFYDDLTDVIKPKMFSG